MDTTEEIPRFSYVSYAARTDVGRRRKNNEDNYGTFPEAGVFCVADGMGGARDGEVASRIVVEHLAGALRNWGKISPPAPIEDRLALLGRCLDAASLWINKYAAAHAAAGCGTTFVGVVLDPGRPDCAVAVHAGDSRLYHIHRRKITQITRDHSVANMAGVKDESELDPALRNKILRAVGIKPAVELERTPFMVEAGDWVLVCSDGLSKMLDDKSIAKIVTSAENGNAAVQALVDEANRLGGKDNITVVLLHIGDLPGPLPVHARLTEAEFLECLGGDASEATTTTETAFTMPTGSDATRPIAASAVRAGEVGTANAGGWLSEDEDSDNTPTVLPVDFHAEGEIASKTTEEVMPPAPPAPSAPSVSPVRIVTEKTALRLAATRRNRAFPFLLAAAALLVAATGVGMRLSQRAHDRAAAESAFKAAAADARDLQMPSPAVERAIEAAIASQEGASVAELETAIPEPEPVALGDAEPEAVALDDAELEPVAPGDADPEAVAPGDAEPEAVALDDTEPEPVAPGNAEPEAVALDDAEPEPVALGDAEPEAVALDDAEPEPVAPGDAEPEAVALDDAEPEAVALGDAGLEAAKKEFKEKFQKYGTILEKVATDISEPNADMRGYHYKLCFRPNPDKGQQLAAIPDLMPSAQQIKFKWLSSGAPEAIDDIKESYGLFKTVVKGFCSQFAKEEEKIKSIGGTDKDIENFRTWKEQAMSF